MRATHCSTLRVSPPQDALPTCYLIYSDLTNSRRYMQTKENYGKAVVSVDILDINAVEMRQMCELEQRIAEVLFTHINKVDANGNSIKKEYLNDDELRLMRAILHTFTKGYQDALPSAFNATLKELKDQEPKPKAHRLPDDDLFGGPDTIPAP